VTIAPTGNPNRDEIDPYTKTIFSYSSDGIDLNLVMAFTIKNGLQLVVHSGLNWEWSSKLVVAPILQILD
jgi:hypothetical protein